MKELKKAFERRDFPDSAFHSQQCIGKCAKALLEEKSLLIRNHGINLGFFLRQAYISEWNEDLEFLVRALEDSWEYIRDLGILPEYLVKLSFRRS